MSPLDSILGLKGLVIERVERRRDIHVWARPANRPVCVHCQQGSVRIKATHQRTLKHTRQGNQLMVPGQAKSRKYQGKQLDSWTPGWVSFTPTIPTKVGQFSTGVDTYDPITTLPVWKLKTNHPLLLTAWLHNQEQAAPRSQRVNRIPGLRPASRKISELWRDFWHVGSLSGPFYGM
ncbi:hypothetical protein [Paracandidimonas soli]|uniref:Uncharacterized protein n=1 Tax=Paracandidimonas soli TaxID=1917182 RepID=A0A4R3V910_9BURK|nr:hypothetical protein [Paracandidimonas soli]TCU98934.1 hypothetical protein EV686_10431 [Paracandidimonas soli]